MAKKRKPFYFQDTNGKFYKVDGFLNDIRPVKIGVKFSLFSLFKK